MGEKLSVVIPAYNVAPHIADCLASVLAQTRRPEEIIVVDDCSTDETPVIVRSFASEDVILLRTSKNSGSSAARNLGIRAAKHELIAFQDADDLWLQHHCEVVARLLDDNHNAALAFSRTKAFEDENWTWTIDIPAGELVNCFLWCAAYTRIPQMNVIARREILLSERGYNTTLRQGQDFDLFLRLAYKYPFICSHDVTTLYRRHPGSITKQNVKRSYRYMYLAQKLFWEEHKHEMCDSLRLSYQRVVTGHWIRMLRDSWYQQDLDLLDFHLSQQELIPDSANVFREWRLRRKFASFRPMWSAILQAKRRIFNRYPTVDEVADAAALQT